MQFAMQVFKGSIKAALAYIQGKLNGLCGSSHEIT